MWQQTILALGLFLLSGMGDRSYAAATDNNLPLLRLATDGTFPPFNFFQSSSLTGFEVDLGNALAAKMNMRAEWKTLPFDSLLIGLSQKRFDVVVASHGITDERAKVVDFSHPHYCTGAVIVTKKDGPASLSDLKGKSVSIQVGTIFVPHLEKVPGIKAIRTFKADTEALQALLGSKVDAWITDKFVALEAVKKHPAVGLKLGDTVLPQAVAMAVSKGNADLLKKLNFALDEVIKDGTHAKLSQKYFGESVLCKKK